MKNLIRLSLSLIMILSLVSCEKSDSSSGSGTYTITMADGTKYVTKYDSQPQPSNDGMFTLQYNKPDYADDLYQLFFFIQIDNNNGGSFDFFTKQPIKTGVTYIHDHNWERREVVVDAQLYINNTDISKWESRVVFESFSYPGKIKGSVKTYDQNNILLYTGDFDFTAK